jgi:hypothetical protein
MLFGKNMFSRGDIVEISGQLAVVVGTARDGGAPEDHVAVWFGNPMTSRGDRLGATPEVWTIPEEYFTKARPAKILH